MEEVSKAPTQAEPKPDDTPKTASESATPKKPKPTWAPRGPEPWDERVNGVEVLDAAVSAIKRHIALPRHAAEAIACWALVSHIFDEGSHSPRLAFLSPKPECGKTTALGVVRDLVARPLMTSNMTTATIFRTIEEYQPTLLIDEADTFLGEKDEMRGILNSGHSKVGATVIRCEGDNHMPRAYSTWSPVVIAMIGVLPDTLESRSIIVSMHRARPDEKLEGYRADRDTRIATIGRKLARLGSDIRANVKVANPEVPKALSGRSADNWRPLIAVADAIGGHWPDTIRKAALALSPRANTSDNLLAAIKLALGAFDGDVVPSAQLLEVLGKEEESPWTGRTPQWLARELKPFGIEPRQHRIGESNVRGYAKSDFEDAFARYLR